MVFVHLLEIFLDLLFPLFDLAVFSSKEEELVKKVKTSNGTQTSILLLIAFRS